MHEIAKPDDNVVLLVVELEQLRPKSPACRTVAALDGTVEDMSECRELGGLVNPGAGTDLFERFRSLGEDLVGPLREDATVRLVSDVHREAVHMRHPLGRLPRETLLGSGR